ncbi:acyl carrier protein [Novosphingobium sp. G106]|uniref:acyl carrier protein n=1 Tax=Novosphingobium sp. G106 TaxID=2849500 RepID=UPI001C2DBDE8|nr:phosphopantetheine-binding protein [Novosphingobium sp. G106]MBV1689580.1 acyl carrier protein [Novosphingobium sp. G106]
MSKLTGLIAKALMIPEDRVVEDLQYNSIPEWDSVAHMALVAELEDSFEIMLDTDDIIAMSSVGKIGEILAKYDVAA